MLYHQERWAVALVVVFTLAAPASFSAEIGTFSGRRDHVQDGFTLFDGVDIDSGRAALLSDGHSFVNLDFFNELTLAGVEIVYLPLPLALTPWVLSSEETEDLFFWVEAGGVLIVQGDILDFAGGYGNLASTFGVSYTSAGKSGPPDPAYAITGHYPGITDGPYGDVTAVQVASTGAINPGGTSGVSLRDHSSGDSFLYVLEQGAGIVVFLTDINSFDDPENTNGFATADGEALWRNMFALRDPVFALSASGSCPGVSTLDIGGATPDGTVAIGWAVSQGSTVIPGGACAGTEVDLANPTLLATVQADANGDFSVSPWLPPQACGLYLQAVDLASCRVSTVGQIPE